MKKTLSIFVIYGILSNVNAQGWSESFNVDATPSPLTLTSDMSWSWFGWGTAEVDSGYLTLVGDIDPWGTFNNCWIYIDQNIDSNAVITPDSVTMYLKVKFTTTGTPTDGDQIHVTVATDPEFLANVNVYTVVSSPVGIIGEFYFGTNVSAGTPHPAIGYDSWFWEKIVVNGDSVSIWAFADGAAPADTATWTYTTDNVAVGAGLPTFIIVGVTDDDSSAVHVDEVWYNETPTGMGISDDAPIASSYELGQNYPNPFNPTTHIRFNIPETGNTKLTVFNIMGEAVANLVDGVVPAGGHTVSWNAANMPTGVYFYRMESGNFSQTRKLLLVK